MAEITNPLKILRGILHDAILTEKRALRYVINNFELEQTYYPAQSFEDIPEAGMVWVIGLQGDDVLITRSHAIQRDIPVQIAVQKRLEKDPRRSTSEIDRYLDLVEQLKDTTRLTVKSDSRFAYQQTVALKDDNGTPFNYVGLRERNTLEAYFTAFYRCILE